MKILFPGMKTTVLLEVMAGKGTEIGSRFEEIARIIDGVKLKEYMGVCVDTCHIHKGVMISYIISMALLTSSIEL